MSSSLTQILENAHALFQQRVAQKIAADAMRKAEADKQLARERAELREWLVQFIPSELLAYVDTSTYTHDAARCAYRSGVPNGVLLELAVPDAAPIRFRVERFREEFALSAIQDGAKRGYVVPDSWRISCDEEAPPTVRYTWAYNGVEDFRLALGAAVDFWREQGAAITSALAQQTAAWAESQPPAMPIPAQPEALSLETRQVLALEAIADALGTLAYNSHC